MILYDCKTSIEREGSFVITKFDADMNIESSYQTSLSECECPAGVRPTCRHRQMLPHFIVEGKADTEWFFCYDDQSWHRPWGELPEELENDGDIPGTGEDESVIEAAVASVVPAASVGEEKVTSASPTSTFKRRV